MKTREEVQPRTQGNCTGVGKQTTRKKSKNRDLLRGLSRR